jgi:hypothetical protein
MTSLSARTPAKTEGIVEINEARGIKQVGAVSLIFLTYNKVRDGRPPIKTHTTFKKVYTIASPSPKELFQETLFSVYPDMELRLEFYVSVLQSLVISGETVFNVCGGSKFMYATMVRRRDPFYERSFVKFLALCVEFPGCLRTSVRKYMFTNDRS